MRLITDLPDSEAARRGVSRMEPVQEIALRLSQDDDA